MLKRFFKVLTCNILGHKWGVKLPYKLAQETDNNALEWLRVLFFGPSGCGFVISTVCKRCYYVKLYALQHEDDLKSIERD